MKIKFEKNYESIISLENLFLAWQEFIVGKRKKRDVQQFSLSLTDNLVQLNAELTARSYKHGGYKAFNISDPKPRNIHKATVRDRVLHHAIYRQLYPFFDRTFIADSFSCRLGKGVHKALGRFESFALQVSRNNTRTAWILKMDVRRFFASIDHEILLGILAAHIPDQDILWLLGQIIESFSSKPDTGLPLGNLTSQLFCNVYLNEFDQFVKHKLKGKYYIRYADDLVLFSDDREWLLGRVSLVSDFLEQRLCLSLHPDKLCLKSLSSGMDFLGWVNFPHHRVLRTTTQRRAMKRVQAHPTDDTVQSYLGLSVHGNAFDFKQRILNWYGLISEKGYYKK